MPPARREVTDADHQAVRELHAQGLGRNEIARRLGRSGQTVSKIAASLGLDFDREAARVATEARVIDARARRAELAFKLLDDAERMRQQLFARATVYNFGGRDNTFEQAEISQPSFRDKQSIMAAIGIAVEKSVRLDEYDNASGAPSDVDAWLDAVDGSDAE